MRDFAEIKKDLEEVANMSCKPDLPKIRVGDILDEDRSVKWNREEVERLRTAYDEEVKRLNREKNSRQNALYAELYKAIMEEVGGNITIEDAKAIYNQAYNEFHSSGLNSVFCCLEDLCNLISNIIHHRN